MSSLTTSLQTSRIAAKIARYAAARILFDAFSYKLLKTCFGVKGTEFLKQTITKINIMPIDWIKKNN